MATKLRARYTKRAWLTAFEKALGTYTSCDWDVFSVAHVEFCGPSADITSAEQHSPHPTAVCHLFTSHVLYRTGYKVFCACSEEEEVLGMKRWLHGKNLVLSSCFELSLNMRHSIPHTPRSPAHVCRTYKF